MNHQAFVKGKKTMLVAPAGHGKTHTIAECLKHTDGRQLILTHTHAGVASIKDKISRSNIKPAKYRITTISSFAQKYSHAFYTGTDIPNQEDSTYHAFVVQKAKRIFECSAVKRVIAASYAGLFVDEYQDCTKDQHAMILALSDTLPTHILGDRMQGIFDFNGDAVDFETDLKEFSMFPELPIPHRWYQEGNNKGLGDLLKGYREQLSAQKPISLTTSPNDGLHVVVVQRDEFQDVNSKYRKGLKKLIENPEDKPEYESLLLLVPEYQETKNGGIRVPKGDIQHRAQIRTQIDYSKSLKLLEALDDRSFYSTAKKADSLINGINRAKKKTTRIRKDALDSLFNKTDLNKWFNNDGLKNKKNIDEKARSLRVRNRIESFIISPTSANLIEIILEAKNGLKLKYKRPEIVFSLSRALKEAGQNNISVYEAMKSGRNAVRRSGRKVHGKCIGTTLLTKGLEFDTVAILDAHKFECPKHLYVALTRCCKKLIIFTEQTTLLR